MPDALVPYTQQDKSYIEYARSMVESIEVVEDKGLVTFYTDHVIFSRMPTAKAVGLAPSAMEYGFQEVFHEMELRLMEHKRFGTYKTLHPFQSTAVSSNIQALLDEVEKIHMGVGQYMFRLNKPFPERFDPKNATESFSIRVAVSYVNRRVFYLIVIVHRSRENPKEEWRISPRTEFQLRWMA